MRQTQVSKNWRAFYDAARHNDVLDERTTIMLHLATSLALGCYP